MLHTKHPQERQTQAELLFWTKVISNKKIYKTQLSALQTPEQGAVSSVVTPAGLCWLLQRATHPAKANRNFH